MTEDKDVIQTQLLSDSVVAEMESSADPADRKLKTGIIKLGSIKNAINKVCWMSTETCLFVVFEAVSNGAKREEGGNKEEEEEEGGLGVQQLVMFLVSRVFPSVTDS